MGKKRARTLGIFMLILAVNRYLVFQQYAKIGTDSFISNYK